MEYQVFRGDYPVIYYAATVSEISVAELTHKLKELANQSRLDRDKTVVYTTRLGTRTRWVTGSRKPGT